MANNLGVTAGVGGFGAAATTILNWMFIRNGINLPVEVAAAFAYLVGMGGHVFMVLAQNYLNGHKSDALLNQMYQADPPITKVTVVQAAPDTSPATPVQG